jgi:hypothetical protein
VRDGPCPTRNESSSQSRSDSAQAHAAREAKSRDVGIYAPMSLRTRLAQRPDCKRKLTPGAAACQAAGLITVSPESWFCGKPGATPIRSNDRFSRRQANAGNYRCSTSPPGPAGILVASSDRMSTPSSGSTLVAITTRATRGHRAVAIASCSVGVTSFACRPRRPSTTTTIRHTHCRRAPERSQIVSALPRPFPPLSGAHTGCPSGAQTPGNRREFPACR